MLLLTLEHSSVLLHTFGKESWSLAVQLGFRKCEKPTSFMGTNSLGTNLLYIDILPLKQVSDITVFTL